MNYIVLTPKSSPWLPVNDYKYHNMIEFLRKKVQPGTGQFYHVLDDEIDHSITIMPDDIHNEPHINKTFNIYTNKELQKKILYSSNGDIFHNKMVLYQNPFGMPTLYGYGKLTDEGKLADNYYKLVNKIANRMDSNNKVSTVQLVIDKKDPLLYRMKVLTYIPFFSIEQLSDPYFFPDPELAKQGWEEYKEDAIKFWTGLFGNDLPFNTTRLKRLDIK